jgi:hypothetical protein
LLTQLEQARKDVVFWKAEIEETVTEKNQWRDKFLSAQKQLREVEHLRRQALQLREDKHHTGKQYDRAIQEVQKLRAQLRHSQASSAAPPCPSPGDRGPPLAQLPSGRQPATTLLPTTLCRLRIRQGQGAAAPSCRARAAATRSCGQRCR